MTMPPPSSLQERALNLVQVKQRGFYKVTRFSFQELTFFARVRDQTLQFAWFAGHVLTLVGSALYFLSVVMFRASSKAYTIAYVGALLSYGVVVYKTHGVSFFFINAKVSF